jgi:molybdate transport system substrate-binding protein
MTRGRRELLLAFLCTIALFIALACSDRSVPQQNSREAASRDKTQEIQIAAAADLKFALDEIIQEFLRENHEVSVKVTYGSSGNFYSQLSNYAPFDIYLSADLAYPKRLTEQGMALPGSEFTYAAGRLVVWVPTASDIDISTLKMEALLSPSVHHIAIANPRHAPYGRAAEAALRTSGVYDSVKGKLVYGENVAQSFQYVQSGAADIGIVALSLALAPDARSQGRYWEIPLDAYPRIEQGGVILKWARQPEAAQAFRSFFAGPKGRQVLRNYGYFLPEG